MLGKLYKYDMKALDKKLLPLAAGIFSSAALCTLTVKILISYFENDVENLFLILSTVAGSIFVGISAVALVAYPVVALFIAFVHYYKNFFSDEGYLTFTLPVKTSELLLSKFLAIVTHALIAFSVFCASVSLIVFIGTSPDSFVNTEVIDVIGEWTELMTEYSGGFITASYGLNLVASGIYFIVIALLSVTMGALIAKKHKILAAIGIYYVINMATSLVSSVFNTLFSWIFIDGLMDNLISASAAVSVLPIMNAIIYGGFAVAGYVVCNYLLKNKLNLQ